MKLRALLVGAWLVAACAEDECACPPAVTVACMGPRTPVALSFSSSCPASDAPMEGYPVGETVVRAGTCSTRVTITDIVAPTMDCAGLSVALRTSREGSSPPPMPRATDGCSERVTVTASPAQLTARGDVSVTYTATDNTNNRATCTASLAVRNAFAVTGLRIAHAEVNDDATRAVLVWDHPADSDATAYRVERAAAMAGPWEALDTVAPDHSRFEETLPGEVAYYRVVTLVDGRDGGASEPVRALAVTATSYALGVQPVPGFLLPANTAARTAETRSAPLHAVVRHPTALARGPYPLALLLHGNHGNCRTRLYDITGNDPSRDDACLVTNTGVCPGSAEATPNAEGLAGLAETLASHGYIVASVDANTVNCRDGRRGTRADGFIAQRALLLIEHLRRWRAWNSPEGAVPFNGSFAGHVDLGHTVLFGHSRGAEAVAAVPQALASAEDVEGIAVASVFSLAPTNFDNPQPGAVPFATIVPVCDGDVFTYDGVQVYDRTLRNADDAAPAAQIFLGHANHDYFNSEWRFDDNGFGVNSCEAEALDTPEIQQRSLEVIVPAWFDGTTLPTGTIEPWLRASGDVPPSITLHVDRGGALDWRRSYSAPHTARIDNFEDADAMHNLLGGTWSTVGGFAAMSPALCTGTSTPACDRAYSVRTPAGTLRFAWPHHNPFSTNPPRAAWALDWNAPDAVAAATLAADGSYDASAYRVLSLRVASRASTLTAGQTAPVDFELRLVDADGHRATALASEVATVPHLYPSVYPRAVLQTLRFTLAGLAARATPPLDLHHLQRVELAMSAEGHERGSLLVTDVEFAE